MIMDKKDYPEIRALTETYKKHSIEISVSDNIVIAEGVSPTHGYNISVSDVVTIVDEGNFEVTQDETYMQSENVYNRMDMQNIFY